MSNHQITYSCGISTRTTMTVLMQLKRHLTFQSCFANFIIACINITLVKSKSEGAGSACYISKKQRILVLLTMPSQMEMQASTANKPHDKRRRYSSNLQVVYELLQFSMCLFVHVYHLQTTWPTRSFLRSVGKSLHACNIFLLLSFLALSFPFCFSFFSSSWQLCCVLDVIIYGIFQALASVWTEKLEHVRTILLLS